MAAIVAMRGATFTAEKRSKNLRPLSKENRIPQSKFLVRFNASARHFDEPRGRAGSYMERGGTTLLWLRRSKTRAKDFSTAHLHFTVKPRR
jgi:hypothetical protein